jgi:hypothetical protein
MKKSLWLGILGILLCLCAIPAKADERAYGFCTPGSQPIVVSGLAAAPNAMAAYAGCTVTVYDAGTTNKTTIYSDNMGTSLGNPFTANTTTGYWDFYAANGSRVDVVISGAGIPTPFTYGDIFLSDSTGGGGGGTPCVTTALSFQYNNGGLFGCNPDLTFVAPHTTLAGASGIFDFSAASAFKVPVTAGQVLFSGTSGAVTGDTTFTWNNSTKLLTLGSINASKNLSSAGLPAISFNARILAGGFAYSGAELGTSMSFSSGNSNYLYGLLTYGSEDAGSTGGGTTSLLASSVSAIYKGGLGTITNSAAYAPRSPYYQSEALNTRVTAYEGLYVRDSSGFAVTNYGILLQALSGTGGGIGNSVLVSGGTGYHAGDFVTVSGGSGTSATIISVDGGGAVLTYTINSGAQGADGAYQPNYGYTTGVKATTPSTGTGTGFTINVTTVTTDWAFYSAGGPSYHAGTFTFGADILPGVTNTSNLGSSSLIFKNTYTNILTLPEGTPPSGVSATDVLYGDSATHQLKVKLNNGSALALPTTDGSGVSGHCVEFTSAYEMIDNGSPCGSGGGGSVTLVSSGDVTGLYTVAVTNPGTTPAIAFTKVNLAANHWWGNPTGGSAAPASNLIGAADTSPNSYAADTGAADAAVVTLTPAVPALVAGLEVDFLPIAANATTTPTLAVNGLTAATITKSGASALAANDLTTTAIAKVIYDGTEWQLQNPQTTSAGNANTALSNLSGVAINTALLPGTTASIALGSASKQWTDLYFGTVSGSYAHFTTSALSSPRAIVVPDSASLVIPIGNTASSATFLSALSSTTGIFATKTLTSTTGASGMTINDAAGVVTIAPANTTGGGNALLECTSTGGANGDYFAIKSGICQNQTPGIDPNHGKTCSGYTVLQADLGIPIFCVDAGAAPVTLNNPASYTSRFFFCIIADAAGTVTVTASGNVRGGATLAIPGGSHDSACFYNNGSTWDVKTSVGF